MPTNLLGAVAPGVEYARVTEEQKKTSVHTQNTAGKNLEATVAFWEISVFTFYPKLEEKIDITL